MAALKNAHLLEYLQYTVIPHLHKYKLLTRDKLDVLLQHPELIEPVYQALGKIISSKTQFTNTIIKDMTVRFFSHLNFLDEINLAFKKLDENKIPTPENIKLIIENPHKAGELAESCVLRNNKILAIKSDLQNYEKLNTQIIPSFSLFSGNSKTSPNPEILAKAAVAKKLKNYLDGKYSIILNSADLKICEEDNLLQGIVERIKNCGIELPVKSRSELRM